MLGLMQDKQLLISSIISFAGKNHGNREIVSNTVEGGTHRYTYADAEKRVNQLANMLTKLGVQFGDRIGTLAWNGYRHLELYFAVPGIGAVCHTVNPRLFPEQISYIINHAEDSFIFTDLTFVPLLEAMSEGLKTVKGIIIMTDASHMPETRLSEKFKVYCYETIIEKEPNTIVWPEFDENTASSLCYTSGTTGNPKGVLYSHRSTLLHSFAANMPDLVGLRARDCLLPVVPMFHANAWGSIYIAPYVGAKLVFSGPHMDGDSLHRQMIEEKVTISAGVPTIWMGLLQHLQQTGKRIDCVERFLIGGSACPLVIIEEFHKTYGIHVDHAWGMTETSPVGTYCSPKDGWDELTEDEKYTLQMKQGRSVFGIEMKIVNDSGEEQPWDGRSFGSLLVRGFWVVKAYLKEEGRPILDKDGWFETGDVATIDPQGFMQIIDRIKDVIKSGGEWISSIELENVAVGYPGIAEAAVIGCAHPKWGERPLLLCIKSPESEVTREEILEHFKGKVASWCIPDDVVFVEELPHTATGKLSKLQIRQRFSDYKFPTA
ncbi:MAG: 3-(methylthio)propionyl-CoA ligase [Geobacteraceae bacterium]